MELVNLFPGGLVAWADEARQGLRVLVILSVAWLMLALARRVIRAIRLQLQRRTDDPEQMRRLDTLGRVLRYGAAVAVSLVAGMLVLAELGIAIAPILASAGVVGLAIGFGAQSLIKDFFTGLFLLIDDQIHQGDVVEVAGKGGLVEEVTLRYVRLRDYEGNVHFIPNGVIDTVTNRSRDHAYAVIDVGVAYREDLDEVFAVMREVGAGMRADPDLAARILEDLEIAGVEQWADSAVVVRARFKVEPLEQWGVRRAFLLRLKQAFDARGIEIPYPHLTVYAGQDKDARAPAWPVQLRN
ncbi:MAG: mechanosensitive ion channel family protein [Pseudomonadota bacterium]